MPLGDSITEGYPVGGGYRSHLYALLTNASFNLDYVGTLTNYPAPSLPDSDHEGHGGYRIDEIESGIEEWSSVVNDPDVILLIIGTNDYYQNYDPTHAINRLQTLIEQMAALRPYADIVVGSIPPFYRDLTVDTNIQTQFNSQIPSVVSYEASRGLHVTFADVHSCCGVSEMESDGVHPNQTGYDNIANIFYAAVTNIMTAAGTTIPPAVVSVTGQADLHHVIVRFSKPVEDNASSLANYSLDGGVGIVQASLDSASDRIVTLTTTLQAANTTYHLTVSGVHDRTAAQNLMTPATVAFQSEPVAEGANYSLVYSLKLPNQINYNTAGVTYETDQHASVGTFSRVAYFVEVQQPQQSEQYLWVSMDAFTTDPTKIGLPSVQTGAFFQRAVSNMNVRSSVGGIVTGDGLSGGNMEFWCSDYLPTNEVHVAGASDSLYDWGDGTTGASSVGYGSMQIHNSTAHQTLFALNSWGYDGYDLDLGIGNYTGASSDWTYAHNASSYIVKRVQVYVLPSYQLQVSSSIPGGVVPVAVSPNDASGQGNGSTPLTRTYGNGTTVTLQAPAAYSGYVFQKWQTNGVDITTSTNLSLTISAAATATAVYRPCALTVNSTNPNSGVSVTATPSDANGATGGVTGFTLSYVGGTTANLTAPASASGQSFSKWQEDGIDISTSPSVSVLVDADHTVTAVYVASPPTVRTLGVTSSGASSVSVAVNVTDNNGSGSGTTPFTRSYNDQVQLTVTAPSLSNGYNFQKWQTNGVDAGTSMSLSLTMSANYNAVAVYQARTLIVQATNPGGAVSITVNPNDLNSQGGGSTPLTRVYSNGTTVTLTAPSLANGYVFQKWQTNGVDASTSASLNLTMSADYTAVAVYRTWSLAVQSTNPGGAVSVTINPQDTNNLGSGSTPLTRNYTNATAVTLTAPSLANGYVFQKWQTNGVDAGTSASLNVTMNADYTAVAVYRTWSLTVQATNPGGAVSVTVSPNDTNNLGNGSTTFTRNYTNSTAVTLTAPSLANGYEFQKWQTNGVDASASASLNLTMTADTTAVAVYRTWKLTVQSSNPGGAVTVTASPKDTNNATGGATPLTLNYTNQTAVTLTAPSLANGYVFQKWQTNGVDAGTSASLNLTMTADTTALAVYRTWSLTVQSSNPGGAVTVAASPKDTNNVTGGATPLTLNYTNATAVTLTAPSLANGYVFQKWQTNGVDAETSASLNLTMTADTTALAVYRTWSLTVQSSNPGGAVTVTASPKDTNNVTGGATPLTLNYTNATAVTLTAPSLANGYQFQKWQTNGVDAGTSTSLNLTMTADTTALAVYQTWSLTVQAINPGGSVTVTASPKDTKNLTGGATPLTLNYTNQTVVTLTAPSLANGYVFQKWQTNGVDAGTSASLNVTMTADTTALAVYRTWSLTVQAINPGGAVTVTASPKDTNNVTGGATPLTLNYTNGTTVTLTVPSLANGYVFQKWQTNGVDAGTSASLNLPLSGDTTALAVYRTWSLAVQALNPGGAVSVTVNPKDTNNLGSGPTPLTRNYTNATSVTLTVPSLANGYVFQKWQTNGVDAGTSPTLNLTMSADTTALAVYRTWSLTVQSSNPGGAVTVTASPKDTNNVTSGATPLTLNYTNATAVTLTAPGLANGYVFQKWQTNGVDATTSASLNLTMTADSTATALYATWSVAVGSSNPGSGVSVTVNPSDTGGHASGTTPFTFTYSDGAVVTFTAASVVSGNGFQKWQTNGVDFSTSQAVNLTVNGNYSLTAFYAPWTLTVNSVNPASGVNTTLSPTDANGLGGGSTTLTRTYTNGTVVSLSTPLIVNGNHFKKWQTNGVDFSTSASVNLTMTTNIVATAFYGPWTLTVNSTDPSSGVTILVSPADTGNQSDGVTGFSRTYNDGTVVNLTAPSLSGLNTFWKWQTNGVDYTTSQSTNLTMNGDYTVTAVFKSSVLGAYVFYNNSAWDGNDPTANANDDNAIAPDKSPLRSGGVATFSNYTSYSRGLNGIIVDISSVPGTLTAATDFAFHVGNNSTPSSWSTAPAPTSITVRHGAGANGSDRVTLIWADNAIQKEWLEVSVMPTSATGLDSPYIFFFGNAVGETGNSSVDANVTSADVVIAIDSVSPSASLTSVADFNRDKKVGSADVVIAMSDLSIGPGALQLINLSGGLMAATASASLNAEALMARQSGAGNENSGGAVPVSVLAGFLANGWLQITLPPTPTAASTNILWSPDLGQSGWRQLPPDWITLQAPDRSREILIPPDQVGFAGFFLLDPAGSPAPSAQ